MPLTIDEVIEQIRGALGNHLPDSIGVTRGDDGDHIIIGNSDLAVAITRKDIDEGFAVVRAVCSIAPLRMALAQHYTMMAAQLDRAMFLSIASSFKEFDGTMTISDLNRRGRRATIRLN